MGSFLVGGWTNPVEKYAQVKFDHFPKDRGENNKYLKPPPSFTFHLQQIQQRTSWFFGYYNTASISYNWVYRLIQQLT